MVHAAAGGTGCLILQACRAAGATGDAFVPAARSCCLTPPCHVAPVQLSRHLRPPRSRRLWPLQARTTPFLTLTFPWRSSKSQVPVVCPTPTTLFRFTCALPPLLPPLFIPVTSGGAGVHCVFDGVGLDTFEHSLACLRKRGMCVLFGAASGQVPLPTPPSHFLAFLSHLAAAVAHSAQPPHARQPVPHAPLFVRLVPYALLSLCVVGCLSTPAPHPPIRIVVTVTCSRHASQVCRLILSPGSTG